MNKCDVWAGEVVAYSRHTLHYATNNFINPTDIWTPIFGHRYLDTDIWTQIDTITFMSDFSNL